MIQHAGGEIWTRMCVGVGQSPYVCTQGCYIAEEVVQGSHSDMNNLFNWEQVMLNLPGNKDYDPKLPWVYKITKDGVIAADLFTYMYNQRCTGDT